MTDPHPSSRPEHGEDPHAVTAAGEAVHPAPSSVDAAADGGASRPAAVDADEIAAVAPERPDAAAESARAIAAARADGEPQEVAEIPIGMRRAAAWSWRLLIVVAAVALLLWGLGHVMSLVVPVLVAVLFTALLTPIVSLLTSRTGMGRGLASGIALIGLIVVVIGMFVLAGQQFVTESGQIQQQAVKGFDQLSRFATQTLHIDQPTIMKAQKQVIEKLQANSESIAMGALTGVETVGRSVTGILVCLFTLFFLLKDGGAIWRWIVGMLPMPARIPVHESFRRGWKALSAYVRTQILVALINGTGIGLGTAFLGLGSYAVPVFMIVFLFSFIPLLGAVVSGIIAALIVLVLKGWIMALVMVGIVILVHFIEADILHPFMMGRAVSLHPLGVFLSVALGAEAAGIAGALFAVPLASFLNATILQLSGRDPNPELGFDHAAASALANRARAIAARRLPRLRK